MIDPAPFIDTVAFLRRNSRYANMREGLRALTAKNDATIEPQLQHHLDALRDSQKRVQTQFNLN